MAEQNAIPIVDLSSFASEGNSESRLESARALYNACHKFGFVQILGHGVEPEVLREAFDWSKKLYGLSHDEKMKAPHPDGPMPHRGSSNLTAVICQQLSFQGYSHLGLEKVYSKAESIGRDAIETDGDSLRQIKDSKVGLYRLFMNN